MMYLCYNMLYLQVKLAWMNRWASTIAGKDQAPTLCHAISGVLLTAEQVRALLLLLLLLLPLLLLLLLLLLLPLPPSVG